MRSYSENKVNLIDFGLAKKFISKDNIHIPQQKMEYFVGNYLYGSINSIQLLQQSICMLNQQEEMIWKV